MRAKALSHRCVYQCDRCQREAYGFRRVLPKGWRHQNGYLLCGLCDWVPDDGKESA